MKSPEMGHGQSENKPLNDSDAKELLEILPKAIENGTATFDPARSIIVKLKEQLKSFPS